MAFSFNFPDPANPVEDNKNREAKYHNDSDEENEVTEDFREIKAPDSVENHHTAIQIYQISEVICIKCLDNKAIESELCQRSDTQCGLQRAVDQHSDLVPNVYEGGLKVWECAVDLAHYLDTCGMDFHSKTVLELGCGAGIPGIVSIVKGASVVHFQDYNPEVIELYTIPNVTLNIPTTGCTTCRYFSGDWKKFKMAISEEKLRYDVILTAETIYKPGNYGKLTAIFKEFLADNGQIFVAAKSNYFGVGGGTREFESFIKSEGVFTVKIVHKISAGVPREILELKFKH